MYNLLGGFCSHMGKNTANKCSETHRGTGRAELLQHVGDEDLEEGLAEKPLPHCAAVIVKFLDKGKTKRKSH